MTATNITIPRPAATVRSHTSAQATPVWRVGAMASVAAAAATELLATAARAAGVAMRAGNPGAHPRQDRGGWFRGADADVRGHRHRARCCPGPTGQAAGAHLHGDHDRALADQPGAGGGYRPRHQGDAGDGPSRRGRHRHPHLGPAAGPQRRIRSVKHAGDRRHQSRLITPAHSGLTGLTEG
jgi:hypothetical protein